MFYILKVKDRDLFFNFDDIVGRYICDIPMLMKMNEEEKNEVIECMMEIVQEINFNSGTEYTKDDLELKKVELKYYD